MSSTDEIADSRKKQTKLKKKARSFKDELRDKFSNMKRPQGIGARSPSPQKMSPVKSPKKKGIGRHNSFTDSSHPDKVTKETDLSKLQNEERKVRKALNWFQDVVDKRTLQMLPGCATVVLETVMEMHQILANYCISNTSSVLMSTYNKVYQSLANLIKWADYILINGDKSVNGEAANEIIKEVQEGIKDLISLAADKVENGKQGNYQTLPTPRTPKTPKSPTSPLASYNLSVVSSPRSSITSDRSSVPEIPLSQHELDILEETNQSRSSQYSTMSASSEDLLDSHSDTTPVGSPPPKPPLPDGYGHLNVSDGDDSSLGLESAPPLPNKRTSNGSSYNDRLSILSGTSSLTDSPRTSVISTSQPAAHGQAVLLNTQSPLSQSPTNSAGSVVSGSSEETEKSTIQRLSNYDNVKTVNSSTTMLRTREVVTCVKKTVANVKVIKKGGVVTEIISTDVSDGGDIVKTEGENVPPLPSKRGSKPLVTRMGSLYDNVPEEEAGKDSESPLVQNLKDPNVLALIQASVSESPAVTQQSNVFQQSFVQTSMQAFSGSSQRTVQMRQSPSVSSIPGRTAISMISETSMSYSSSETMSSSSGIGSIESLPKAPPLPPKTRNVQAYMQMFGEVNNAPNLNVVNEISRHSVNFYKHQFSQHQMDLFIPYQQGLPRSNTISGMSSASSRTSDTFSLISTSSGDDNISFLHPAPLLPPKLRKGNSTPPKGRKTALTIDTRKAISLTDPCNNVTAEKHELPKRISEPVSPTEKEVMIPLPDVQKDTDSDFIEISTLDEIDVSDQLIRKKEGDDGPDIRGGCLDALVVHATIAAKNDFMYQEAFLTTYRTFITPKELIEKLIQRYSRFARIDDSKRKKLARNTFSLLIRVVDELCTEIGEEVIQVLMDLVFRLLCDGELMLARLMRKKVLEKNELRQKLHTFTPLASLATTAKSMDLTDFRSRHIAEQMTLLDSELFHIIEIPEVLLYSKEQSEERSPHLTRFTEHFNKMSFWCRTKVLQPEDPKDREKYYSKFVKVMKHLRELNNFNSFLALLSALDSAPVRRLEWPKQSQDMLRDFCGLIDSSSSFRAYRQALAETEPPSIPYLGMILQDLTFVHIGNPDHLQDGSINFAKRWQQFHILDNMRRFKQCLHEIKRNGKVLSYFNSFDDHLCEESLWQISESIKPKVSRMKNH